MANTVDIQTSLMEAFKQFEIIDCHEHLSPESERVKELVDATNLFSHYCQTDLITAGMLPAHYDQMLDHNYPVEYRWELVQRCEQVL